jgi:hypothetical protein
VTLPKIDSHVLKKASFDLEERCVNNPLETVIAEEPIENIKHYVMVRARPYLIGPYQYFVVRFTI